METPKYFQLMDLTIQSLNPKEDLVVNGYACGDKIEVCDYKTYDELTDNEKITLIAVMKSVLT
jgi:hypothetical protein